MRVDAPDVDFPGDAIEGVSLGNIVEVVRLAQTQSDQHVDGITGGKPPLIRVGEADRARLDVVDRQRGLGPGVAQRREVRTGCPPQRDEEMLHLQRTQTLPSSWFPVSSSG